MESLIERLLHTDSIIEYKNNIREKIAFKKDKYNEALKDLETYEKYLNKTNNKEKMERWFVKYNTGLTYLKLKNEKLSLKYTRQAIKYNDTYEDYTKNLWLLDSCLGLRYDKMSDGISKKMMLNKRNAIQQRCVNCYDELISGNSTTPYDKVRYKLLQLAIMFNMYKLQENTNEMLNIVIVLDGLDDSVLHINSSKKDEQKEYLLINGIKELIEIYIKNKNIFACIRLFRLIKNKHAKEETEDILKCNKIIA